MLALLLPAVPRANGAEVTVEFLYNNLEGGSWIDVDDYGYGWQPDVAVSSADWRPYADGYWAYTDYGWTWVSYEDFGWATYHYGRWARLADYGWVWFPGSDLEWGPAWVSWRFGGNQCGWAPLPPRGPGFVYDGRPIGGHVDIEFDIGPAYYNFVDIRYIGEPVLRSHIYAPNYNVTYISQTVNVTNITVKNKIVYNYGPDIEVLSRHSARPIQRLKIERETNVDFAAVAKNRGLTKVQGDKLVVAAPTKIEKSTKQFAPPRVKTKIAKNQLKMEKGWGVAGDEKAQADLKQKIRTQDPKKVPPPTEGGAVGATGATTPGPDAGAAQGSPTAPPASAGASPMTSATLPPTDSDTGRGQGRGKRGQKDENAQKPAGTMPDTASPGATASPVDQMERGRGKGKGKRDGTLPGMTPSPSGEMSPMEGTSSGMERGKGKRNRDFQAPTGPSTDGTPGGPKAMRGMNREPGASDMSSEGQGQGVGNQKGRRFNPPPGGPEQTGAPIMGGQESQGMQGGGGGGGKGKNRGRGQTVEPSGGPVGATGVEQGQGQGRPEKGKKRQKDEATPAPTP